MHVLVTALAIRARHANAPSLGWPRGEEKQVRYSNEATRPFGTRFLDGAAFFGSGLIKRICMPGPLKYCCLLIEISISSLRARRHFDEKLKLISTLSPALHLSSYALICESNSPVNCAHDSGRIRTSARLRRRRIADVCSRTIKNCFQSLRASTQCYKTDM